MDMPTERVTIQLSREQKDRLRRAAAQSGVSVAAFVRNAIVREADDVLANQSQEGAWPRTCARAKARMSTDEIMQLTRGP